LIYSVEFVALGKGNTPSKVWDFFFIQIGLILMVFEEGDVETTLHHCKDLKLILITRGVSLRLD